MMKHLNKYSYGRIRRWSKGNPADFAQSEVKPTRLECDFNIKKRRIPSPHPTPLLKTSSSLYNSWPGNIRTE